MSQGIEKDQILIFFQKNCDFLNVLKVGCSLHSNDQLACVFPEKVENRNWQLSLLSFSPEIFQPQQRVFDTIIHAFL